MLYFKIGILKSWWDGLSFKKEQMEDIKVSLHLVYNANIQGTPGTTSVTHSRAGEIRELDKYAETDDKYEETKTLFDKISW